MHLSNLIELNSEKNELCVSFTVRNKPDSKKKKETEKRKSTSGSLNFLESQDSQILKLEGGPFNMVRLCP